MAMLVWLHQNINVTFNFFKILTKLYFILANLIKTNITWNTYIYYSGKTPLEMIHWDYGFTELKIFKACCKVLKIFDIIKQGISPSTNLNLSLSPSDKIFKFYCLQVLII